MFRRRFCIPPSFCGGYDLGIEFLHLVSALRLVVPSNSLIGLELINLLGRLD